MVAPVATPKNVGAMWIRAGEDSRPVFPANGATFTLAELQRYAGGYVQMIKLASGLLMFVDEDGKGRSRAFNLTATLLAAGVLMEGDWISGDALLCPPDLIEE
jgi:hypothetical protein